MDEERTVTVGRRDTDGCREARQTIEMYEAAEDSPHVQPRRLAHPKRSNGMLLKFPTDQ